MKKYASNSIEDALRFSFPEDQYALLFEVRNSTGYGKRIRSADALAMSLWPSRGLELIGFEIKRSRIDWLKELSQPEKAEEICRFCDQDYASRDAGYGRILRYFLRTGCIRL